MKILLPLDTTLYSEQVIPFILAEGFLNPKYVLLRVIRTLSNVPIETPQYSAVEMVPSVPEIEQIAIEESLRYLNRLLEKYRLLPLDTRCLAKLATTSSKGIVECAETEEGDLIAMMLQEHRGPTRLFKGRTAKNVIKTSKVEVRIFRAADLNEMT